MKIIVENKKGKSLDAIEVDIESMVTQAETARSADPVSSTAQLVNEQIEERGLVLNQGELSGFESMLGKALSSGHFPLEFKIKGRQKGNMFNTKHTQNNNSSKLLPKEAMDVFEAIMEYPNKKAEEEYNDLIGLDNIKERLAKEASLLLSTENLKKWSKKYHKKKVISACAIFEKRLPLIVFGGDIGTGKTALAESFGDSMAKLLGSKIFLLRISVQIRGTGLVGEMTQLINKAFREAKRIADEAKNPVILLVDEADTLAQSRETIHMHHEDKAGVNALIQGIDHSKHIEQSILVVFCTNRLSAIDPAIIRRAAIVHEFTRPNKEQLEKLFERSFGDTGLSKEQLAQLVSLAGPIENREYGFSYSDILNKVVPEAIMKAYPEKPLTFELILAAVQKTQPTPPFRESYEEKKES
ncbi:AAA family ATPase [Candidatus Woesebacteria bacterium]|nr:AAA family ATPase [Candidatus Woesebacteria bacterium]